MLADLLAAAETLNKLEERTSVLQAEKTRLQTRIQDINDQLVQIRVERKANVQLAKQAAQDLIDPA